MEDLNPKIVTVVQARTGSSRLPGKVLMDILGETVLYRQLERMKRAKLIGTIVVATTPKQDDDPIISIAESLGLRSFKGEEDDLLDRHYQAALPFEPDAVIKIPSDCPLIDPEVIDRVIQVYLDSDADFVSNLHPPTYPDGNDVEVMSWKALETAWKEASKAMEREHTTPFIWEHTDRFKVVNVTWKTGLDYSMSHRFTIDYPEDYQFIHRVYEELHPTKPDFGLVDILDLLAANPAIFQINSRFAGVNWYRDHLDELKTIKAYQTRKIEDENNKHE
jgi:spore coat polysaccharide biosynthesis protein SpsF